MAENDAKQDALFVNLILVFKSAAMQQMGKIINPLTGNVEKNLDQARFSIDTLEMLKNKTGGNLPNELERLLDSTLLELRMNYVEEAKAEGAAGPEDKAGAEKPGGGEDTAPDAGPATAGESGTEPEREQPQGDSKTAEAGEGPGGPKRARRRSKDPATTKASSPGKKRRRQGGKEA
jgi:hypothetical protein